VVSSQVAAREMFAAVEAEITVTSEQRGVGQRRRRIYGLRSSLSARRNNRVQVDQALFAATAVPAAANGQAGIAQSPGDGFADIQTAGVLPADPVEDAPGRVQRQNARAVDVPFAPDGSQHASLSFRSWSGAVASTDARASHQGRRWQRQEGFENRFPTVSTTEHSGIALHWHCRAATFRAG